MKIDPSRAIGAYAAAMTLAVAWLALGGAAGTRQLKTLDVERINIREPDGTLRLTIASHARMPGIVVGKTEFPHPNRPDAGMIFYNDEGTENGGLVFDGRNTDGRPTNGGSLTFDRWHQDQTIQLRSTEKGDEREAALVVNDRADKPIDFDALRRGLALPPGEARTALLAGANLKGTQRAYLGRMPDGSAQLVLRDSQGRPRVRLAVDAEGVASLALFDATGRATRTIRGDQP